MIGAAPFTWVEVMTMQEVFFPDIDKQKLMQRTA